MPDSCTRAHKTLPIYPGGTHRKSLRERFTSSVRLSWGLLTGHRDAAGTRARPMSCFSRAIAKQLRSPPTMVRATMQGKNMATLDWSQCPVVESVPGRLSGAWVFRDTRMPVSAVFENLEAGASIEDIIEQFDITREQISAVLEFAARSLDPAPAPAAAPRVDAHSL
jgi:uncharacterized protein (DUF433 family)